MSHIRRWSCPLRFQSTLPPIARASPPRSERRALPASEEPLAARGDPAKRRADEELADALEAGVHGAGMSAATQGAVVTPTQLSPTELMAITNNGEGIRLG